MQPLANERTRAMPARLHTFRIRCIIGPPLGGDGSTVRTAADRARTDDLRPLHHCDATATRPCLTSTCDVPPPDFSVEFRITTPGTASTGEVAGIRDR